MVENKLKAIIIDNFMSIESGRVDFDDQNIISLCGYNDSGKSAITRLLEVLFYNAYSSDQAKFIKDGAEFWHGGLEFDDGVVLDRYKYADGKSVWDMTKDGQVVYTNRLANGGVAAMSDIPDVIAKYLGVIQDEYTEEKLNVRRNTDRLFLITTTGGDNYKILNSVLQSETLAEASRQLNEDKNKLNTEVLNHKTTRDVVSKQLLDADVVPEVVMTDLKDLVQKVEENGGKLARITRVSEAKNSLNSVAIHEELSSIDMTALTILQTVAQAFNICNKPIVEEVSVVDVVQLYELQQIAKLKSAMFVPMYDAVSTVETERYNAIMEVGKLYNALYNVNVAVSNTEQSLSQAKQELASLSAQYNFRVCKNCGSVVE